MGAPATDGDERWISVRVDPGAVWTADAKLATDVASASRSPFAERVMPPPQAGRVTCAGARGIAAAAEEAWSGCNGGMEAMLLGRGSEVPTDIAVFAGMAAIGVAADSAISDSDTLAASMP